MSLLIIHESIVHPPTWATSLRDATLYASIFLKAEIVVDCNGPVDPIVKYLRGSHAADFIEDFLPETNRMSGLRLKQEPWMKALTPHTLHQALRYIAVNLYLPENM